MLLNGYGPDLIPQEDSPKAPVLHNKKIIPVNLKEIFMLLSVDLELARSPFSRVS